MRKITLILLALLITFTLAACSGSGYLSSTDVVDTKADPESWSSVPAGSYFSGRKAEQASIDYDYEMMTYHVTNTQFAEFLNAGLQSGLLRMDGDRVVVHYDGDPFAGVKHEERIDAGDWTVLTVNAPAAHLTYDQNTFMVQPGFENHPVNSVSWFGANAYCLENGWRLPTEAEWEKAARGGEDDRAYPWGNEIEGNHANYYNSGDPWEAVTGKHGDTTPIGYYDGTTYPDGYATFDNASPYGIYDMSGNVWQWTANVYEGIHYRYLRGGSKSDYAYNMRVWSRNNASPQLESIHFGFRCVREAGQ